ncbi:hypothetical protein F2P56_015959 [Juglans regia]|uniref:C2H2-type domain-containing protein n=1 Tax=Juglans regia TaxID=51240 RepID=A0A834CQ98_JUGRE|nr:hypothetical protein F2P56_015959 [Juglans regia]
MERKSLTNSLKDHSIDTRAIKYCINDNKYVMPKDSANCDSQSYGDDYVNGLSWPPRSYTCNFCKREFKSAQALGGHMNVHRRDRARLRQSPPRDGQYPFLNLNCNPNPKFSPSSSSSLSSPSTRLTPFAFPLPSFISPTLSPLTSPSSASPNEVQKWGLVSSLFDSLSPKSMDLTKLKSEKSFNGAKNLIMVSRKEAATRFSRSKRLPGWTWKSISSATQRGT